jgi:hypothetical protein
MVIEQSEIEKVENVQWERKACFIHHILAIYVVRSEVREELMVDKLSHHP